MKTMAPTRPAEHHACRIHLPAGPAEARRRHPRPRLLPGVNAVAAISRNLRLPRGRPAPSPYTCTHDPDHAGQASR